MNPKFTLIYGGWDSPDESHPHAPLIVPLGKLECEMAEEMRGHVELAARPSRDEQQSNRGAVG
jgi:hypothetical protein